MEYIKTLSFNDDEQLSGETRDGFLTTTPKMVGVNEVESRVERLNQTWGYADATVRGLSNKYRKLWNGAITELRDYKGTLYVTWRDELSRVMFEGVILGAWEAQGEHMHSHVLANPS
jgi:hypothetical protein